MTWIAGVPGGLHHCSARTDIADVLCLGAGCVAVCETSGLRSALLVAIVLFGLPAVFTSWYLFSSLWWQWRMPSEASHRYPFSCAKAMLLGFCCLIPLSCVQEEILFLWNGDKLRKQGAQDFKDRTIVFEGNFPSKTMVRSFGALNAGEMVKKKQGGQPDPDISWRVGLLFIAIP